MRQGTTPDKQHMPAAWPDSQVLRVLQNGDACQFLCDP